MTLKDESRDVGGGVVLALLWEWLKPFLAPLNDVVHLVVNYLRARKAASPLDGPPSWPIVGCMHKYWRLDPAEALSYTVDLPRKHPVGVVWLGEFPVFYISDPQDIERVTNNTKCNDKFFLYLILENWLGSGLISSSGNVWKRHQKIIAPAFHTRVLESFLPIYNRQTEDYLEKLEVYKDGSICDIMFAAERLSLNIICEAAMGVNMSQESYAVEYVENLMLVEQLLLQRLIRPWLFPNWAFALSSYGRQQKAALKRVHGIRNRIIQERRSELLRLEEECGGSAVSADEIGKKRRLAFLDHLLLSVRAGASMTDQEIADEVDTFMFAGHDTNSLLMSFSLFEMARHPEIQDKVIEELETLYDPSEKNIEVKVEDLNHLSYLEMVLKETLRFYPPVPAIGRVPREDIKLATRDVVIPEGACVAIIIHGTHRNPAYYENPDEFNPERFSPENSKGRHPCAFMPFSHGQRSCIGKRLAMMEAKTVISKILWRFRVLPVPNFEPVLTWGATMKPISGVQIRLEERRR